MKKENIWTKLLVKSGRALLFVGSGQRFNGSPFSQDEGDVLAISLKQGQNCPIMIPGGTSFSFEEDSIFQGHDVGGQSVSNDNDADAMLACIGGTLVLQPVGETTDSSISLVDSWDF